MNMKLEMKYQQSGFLFDGEEFQPYKLKQSRKKKAIESEFEKLDFMAILFPEDYSKEYLEWIHSATQFTWVDDDIESICRLMFKDTVQQLRNLRVSKLALDDIMAWVFDEEGEKVETDFSFSNLCMRLFNLNSTVVKGAILEIIQNEVYRIKRSAKPSNFRLGIFNEVLRVHKDDFETFQVKLTSVEQNISFKS